MLEKVLKEATTKKRPIHEKSIGAWIQYLLVQKLEIEFTEGIFWYNFYKSSKAANFLSDVINPRYYTETHAEMQYLVIFETFWW